MKIKESKPRNRSPGRVENVNTMCDVTDELGRGIRYANLVWLFNPFSTRCSSSDGSRKQIPSSYGQFIGSKSRPERKQGLTRAR